MKFSLLVFILSTISCQSQVKSYDKAMQECDQKMDEMNKVPNTVHSSLYPYCMQGATIPKFKATTFDNHKIDASYFLGKVTVLNFWLTTCPPCIAEIPGLNILHDKYAGKKVNFLAIGKNPEIDRKNFLKIHPWNFEQIQNGQEIIDSVFKIKWGYPTTYIIDEKMKIIDVIHGGYHDERAATEIQNRIVPVLEKELAKH